MNNHTYRTKKVNKIDWSQLRERWAGQALVFAVDVFVDSRKPLKQRTGAKVRPAWVTSARRLGCESHFGLGCHRHGGIRALFGLK